MTFRGLTMLASLAAACLAQPAWGADIDKQVRGTWLLTTPTDLRTWVLEVLNHKADGPDWVEYHANYGANGERSPKHLDVVFATAPGRLAFSFRGNGTLLQAQSPAADVFEGTFTNPGGRIVPVRLERIPEDQLRKRKLNIPAVRKDAKLEIIYLGADDCPYCTQWESRSKAELLHSAEGKAVSFTAVKGETLRNPIEERHYPTQLKWVFKEIGPSRGVPKFLLAIDGKVMLTAFGTGGYADVFQPALKEVVARRAAAR